MQTEQKPPWWALLRAQALAYVLTTLLTLILFFLVSAILPLSPNDQGWPLLIIVILVPGTLLAAIQRSALRKWLPVQKTWLIASALAMPVLLLAAYGLGSLFVLHTLFPPGWLGGDYTRLYAVEAVVYRWGLIGGSLVGLACGLVFGLIQAYFLPWRRRMWWGLSALAWALIGVLVVYLANSLTLLIYAL